MAHVFEKKWRSQDVRLRENVDFSALLLSERVIDGLNNAGFKKPSPIQLEAIPMGRFGKDLMVQAKSGTGKTLVFVIVALEMLKRKLFRPQVLVVVPTREIATQICTVMKAVGSSFPKLSCSSFIGGLPLFEDKEKAVTSQIVVGTPGRLRHLIQLKCLPTNSIRLLVFDEADELLECTSFTEDIEEIFNALPDDKQVIATSATYSPKNRKLMLRYLRDPHLVRLNARELALLGMVHYAQVVEFCPMPVIMYRTKLDALEKILKTVTFAQCLLFCNGIQRVEILYKDIKRWGFSVAYISSAKEQCDRLKAIDRLKRFKCKVLVSSDLTARGIDAENVDLVINFDLSFTSEVYMHRVGRAGRYGSIGVAVSIIDNDEIRHLRRIEKEGSFKTFKLPNPIPKDLILYPPEGEFVIEESDTDNVDCSEVKKSTNSKKAKRNSRKNVSTESSQLKSASEISDDDDNKTHVEVDPLTELATQSASDKTKIEKIDKNDIDENIENIPLSEEMMDKLNESTVNDSIDLDENKDSAVLDNCDKSELIDNESVDKHYVSDICKNPGDLCDRNVFEKQDAINGNVEKVVQFSDNVGMNSCSETDVKKLNEVDNVPESSKLADVKETNEDDSANCDQKNTDKSSHTLNNMIRTFVNAYDLKNVESTLLKMAVDDNSDLSEVSGKKFITVDVINNLKSQKIEYLYKTLKAFQEGQGLGADKENEGGEIGLKNENSLPLQNGNVSAADFMKNENNVPLQNGNVSAADIMKNENNVPLQNGNASATGFTKDEINIVQEKYSDNLEPEKKDFPEKPSFESTPQPNVKIKQESSAEGTDVEPASKPVIQNKLVGLFRELSENSDSSDSGEDENEDAEQNSLLNQTSLPGSSELYSPVTDSEGDSDSEDASSSDLSESDLSSDDDDSDSSIDSSVNEEGGSTHHHDHSRTGRQNPSLVSHSSRRHMHYASAPVRYPQNHQCLCCGATVPCWPLQQDYDRSRLCSGRAYQNTRGHDVTQSFLPRGHSNCHRSRISRNATRLAENEYRSDHRPHHASSSSSSRHHHTLGCFMPTEHRCHPNTPDYACSQGEVCEMWYKMFYDQWLHIQNVVNN